MEKQAYLTGAFFFLLAVAIGAFGAHGLEDILTENGRVDTFETGVKYHFYHSIALLILGVVAGRYENINFKWVKNLFLLGIIIFSGSLYALSLTNIGVLGAITPIGGACFIIGWVLFILKVARVKD